MNPASQADIEANDHYDIFSAAYETGQAALWERMRDGCPVAHAEQWGGSWMVVGYDDVHGVLHRPETFSSRAVEIAGAVPEVGGGLVMPPVTSDPPAHRAHRDLLAPYFTPARALAMEPFVRDTARRLAEGLARRGEGDAMADFTQPLTLAVLTHILAVPAGNQQRFADWATRIMRLGPTDPVARGEAINEVLNALGGLLDERVANPGDDVVSHIAQAQLDGAPLSRKHQLGSLMLLVLAGADTTWSTLGASLCYLAQHPDERQRLIADPKLLRGTAIEEFLRVYAPVTLARITTAPTELHGRCPAAHERVILPLAAANRDPAVFEAPGELRLDRARNRHLSFGSGTHRCLGAHVARLELRLGLEEWLRAMPDYRLDSAGPIRWSQGQVRGPESVPFRVGAAA